MVVSGNDASIELRDLDSKSRCSRSFPIEFAQGGLINEDTILACNSLDNLECYSMSLKDFKPKLLDFNVKYRLDSHSVVLDTGELWITGGSKSGVHFDDTEIVSLTEIKSGPTLPEPVDGHCLVKINSTTIALLTGHWSGPNTNKTWFIHTDSEPWRMVAGPEVNIARYVPACIKFEFNGDTFIALVGSSQPKESKKVEFLNLKDSFWINGRWRH